MEGKKPSESDVFPSDDQETPIKPTERRTGMDARSSNVKFCAEAEALGDKNTGIPGDPNQGTEAR